MAINPVAVIGLSPWEILGLHPGASPEEVSGAMRLLAKVVHPDQLPRGKGIFQVIQAAADACKMGGSWPLEAIQAQGSKPPVPSPPPAPGPPPRAPQRAQPWRINKKGNWSRRIGLEAWIVAYIAKDGSGWRFMGPLDGVPYFDTETFSNPEAAKAAADEFFRGM